MLHGIDQDVGKYRQSDHHTPIDHLSDRPSRLNRGPDPRESGDTRIREGAPRGAEEFLPGLPRESLRGADEQLWRRLRIIRQERWSHR